MWIFIIVFNLMGLISVFSPRTSWLLSNWWRFEGDAEPSSVSLLFYRIGGVVFLIVGISLLFREI
ncbi:DUF6199 family natural product biosynthesis protein [Paenibacillus sp. FSL K6-1318]|uniref:DUF6199 family natural product biosynthesis protein n=1 Tax=Paenibacillus sp. FSL K6-1318 TaxID=2975291 RepID=UPI0030ED3B17